MSTIRRNTFVTDAAQLTQANTKIAELKASVAPVSSRSFSQVVTAKENGREVPVGNEQRDITYFKDKATGAVRNDVFQITHKAMPGRESGGQEWFVKENDKWVRYTDSTLDGKDNIDAIVTDGFEVVVDRKKQVQAIKNLESKVAGSSDFTLSTLDYQGKGLTLRGELYDGANNKKKAALKADYGVDALWNPQMTRGVDNAPVPGAPTRNTISTDPQVIAAASEELKALRAQVEPYRSFSYSHVMMSAPDAAGKTTQIGDQQRDITYFKDKVTGQPRDDIFQTTFKAEAGRASGSQEWYIKSADGKWKILKDGALDGNTKIGSVVLDGFEVYGNARQGVLELRNLELNVLNSATNDYTMALLAYGQDGLTQRGMQFDGVTNQPKTPSKKDFGIDTGWKAVRGSR